MQVSIRRKYEKQEVSGDYFYMLRIRFFSKNSGFHGIILYPMTAGRKRMETFFSGEQPKNHSRGNLIQNMKNMKEKSAKKDKENQPPKE